MRPYPLLLALAALTAPALAQDDDDDEDVGGGPVYDFGDLAVEGALMSPSAAPVARPGAARMSATAGGAQDAAYFRDQAASGRFPRPEELALEGLLSEHDLPLADPPPCRRLLCPAGQAMAADLLAQPEVDHIAQIGFSSRLSGESFERSPLNLVVVVDESGSMSGAPIELARESLVEIARRHLGPKDQISLVTFSDDARVELAPVPASRVEAFVAAAERLAVDGGTHLDAGLALGLELARSSRRAFDGQTRVLLLTDERPNLGRTDADGFKARLRAASEEGIGLTTIGVGADFGAALAAEVAAVRGANLVYFPDPLEMRSVLAADFDTLVTPLAYDMELVVRPAPGVALAGVYGLPGDAIERLPDGGFRLQVATLFASRRGGGILLGFSGAPRGALATVSLGYDPVDGPREQGELALRVAEAGAEGVGLIRGWRLVDQATTLRLAASAYHEGRPDAARQSLDALARRFAEVSDPALDDEKRLVDDLRRLVGAPVPPRERDLVSGLPR